MRKLATIIILPISIAASITTCFASSEPHTDRSTSVNSQTLTPGESGLWQTIWLPNKWFKKHKKDSTFQSAYITLRSPSAPDIIDDYAPCWSPPRIHFGIINDEANVTEYKLECINYCEIEQQSNRKLWGSLTRLEGISIEVFDNGQVTIHKHFRKSRFSAPGKEPFLSHEYDKETNKVSTNYTLKQLLALKDKSNSCSQEP